MNKLNVHELYEEIKKLAPVGHPILEDRIISEEECRLGCEFLLARRDAEKKYLELQKYRHLERGKV